jgi:hypothetical protein
MWQVFKAVSVSAVVFKGSNMSRFVCRFAIGRDGLAYSSVWRVWTAKNKPDLYIAVASLGGELKASVHAPYPPHTGWKRHFGFDYHAASFISQQAKQAGGPHKVQWTGHQIAPDMTVEYRVIIRGSSLENDGQPVANNVVLVPIPSRDDVVEVYVILGPTGWTTGPPRERDRNTYLLSEGRLSDGRSVWVVYIVRPKEGNETISSRKELAFETSYCEPGADLKSARLRAITFGAGDDGTLVFLDLKATAQTGSSSQARSQ